MMDYFDNYFRWVEELTPSWVSAVLFISSFLILTIVGMVFIFILTYFFGWTILLVPMGVLLTAIYYATYKQ